MNKRIIKIGGAVLLTGAVFIASYGFFHKENTSESLFSSGEQTPEYVFTYADNQPDDYPTTQGAKKFAELVWERTEGRIKIKVFSGGEMGNENEIAEQVQYG
ncbi:MAG: TRAP transporter substrate-binding protein, partial [Paenibacillaceae bacterium]|nr:TRAP transporter substrate-binding protein [Paenibacillaceae bacterium]